MSEIIVPDSLREKLDRIAGRRREVWLVAVVVAVLGVGALALWARGAPARIAPPATIPAGTLEPSHAPREVVFVHVTGAVLRPGLYDFVAGTRVARAVRAARPLPSADVEALNLAQILADGTRLYVPRRGEAPVAGTPAPATPGATATVNINTADQAQLETLPGVGPVTAAAILEYRMQAGVFESVEQLLEVSGIGPATLEEIRPHVTV